MPDPKAARRRKTYRKPALKFDHRIEAVAGLCNPEPGTFYKQEGEINPFGNPCLDVFT